MNAAPVQYLRHLLSEDTLVYIVDLRRHDVPGSRIAFLAHPKIVEVLLRVRALKLVAGEVRRSLGRRFARCTVVARNVGQRNHPHQLPLLYDWGPRSVVIDKKFRDAVDVAVSAWNGGEFFRRAGAPRLRNWNSTDAAPWARLQRNGPVAQW